VTRLKQTLEERPVGPLVGSISFVHKPRVR
jgi:hypothetical protein